MPFPVSQPSISTPLGDTPCHRWPSTPGPVDLVQHPLTRPRVGKERRWGLLLHPRTRGRVADVHQCLVGAVGAALDGGAGAQAGASLVGDAAAMMKADRLAVLVELAVEDMAQAQRGLASADRPSGQPPDLRRGRDAAGRAGPAPDGARPAGDDRRDQPQGHHPRPVLRALLAQLRQARRRLREFNRVARAPPQPVAQVPPRPDRAALMRRHASGTRSTTSAPSPTSSSRNPRRKPALLAATSPGPAGPAAVSAASPHHVAHHGRDPAPPAAHAMAPSGPCWTRSAERRNPAATPRSASAAPAALATAKPTPRAVRRACSSSASSSSARPSNRAASPTAAAGSTPRVTPTSPELSSSPAWRSTSRLAHRAVAPPPHPPDPALSGTVRANAAPAIRSLAQVEVGVHRPPAPRPLRATARARGARGYSGVSVSWRGPLTVASPAA